MKPQIEKLKLEVPPSNVKWLALALVCILVLVNVAL